MAPTKKDWFVRIVINHARHAQAPPHLSVKPVPRIKSNTIILVFNNALINITQIQQIKVEHASSNVLSKRFLMNSAMNANPASQDVKHAKAQEKKTVLSALRVIILSIRSNALNTVHLGRWQSSRRRNV